MNNKWFSVLSTQSHPRLRQALAAVIFLVGVVISVMVAMTIRQWEANQIENEFERLVGSQAGAPQATADLYLESIQSMGAYLGATGIIRSNEFQQYAQEMTQRRDAIRSVAWIPRIFANDRQAHELAMRAQGFEDYSVNDCQGGAGGEDDVYYPVTYMDPLLRPVLGFCMQNVANWETAMEQARDQGEPVASDSLFSHGWKELDEHPHDLAFEVGIFQPIYHYGLPADLGSRRANLRGFLFIVLQADLIVNDALTSLQGRGIDIELLSSGVAESPDSLGIVTPLTIAGYAWTVVMRPTEAFITSRQTSQPWGVLIVGVVLTSLLTAYLLMLMGRTAQVEQLVDIARAELKESEMQLIQSEKMATIGQMVAGMVHEINTPLGYVKSSVALVRDNIEELLTLLETAPATAAGDDDEAISLHERLQSLAEDGVAEENRMLLDNALNGLEQINTLVTSLKDFSRLDRERVARHDINKGLADTLVMAHHLTKRHVEVVQDFQEGLPPVTCSPAQINQVFLNLIVNAVHAVQNVRERGTVTITTRHDDQHLHVTVADDGCGIPADKLGSIFEPFYTTKKSGKGTGLGLAIVKKIIDEHGGVITVNSDPGVGTQFTVSLPLAIQ